MVTKVNGKQSGPCFHPEALYELKFHLNDDLSRASPISSRSTTLTRADGNHTRHPSEDADAIGHVIADLIAATAVAAGTSDDPQGYGETEAHELFPDVVPDVVGTPAVNRFGTRNGRSLADNAPETTLSGREYGGTLRTEVKRFGTVANPTVLLRRSRLIRAFWEPG